MKDTKNTGRPIFLSILCLLGLLGCFLKTILVISPSVQSHGPGYAFYLSFSAIFMIACICGLWLMKKWAFWALLFYAIMDQLVYFKMGLWNPKTFVLVPLILLTALVYYRRLE